jgi:hypothetical protein
MVTSLNETSPVSLSFDAHVGGYGHDFGRKAPLSLGSGGALLRLQRIFVLRLPADAIALGDRFGGLQHRHVDVLVHGNERGIAADAHFGRLDKADRILASGGDDIHPVDDHLLGGSGDRHQAGGALAVDGLGADGDGAAGAERDLAADIA